MVKRINTNAYKLGLLEDTHIYKVFHTSPLDPYTKPVTGQESLKLPLVIIDDAKEYELNRVLNLRDRRLQFQCLVQWAGYDYVHTSWEPAENLEHCPELV